jgi:selenocysteine-specific elongation factor
MPVPANGNRSQFVICLAGHIDHGKSAIVRTLTGGTVDRLPEEKRRGITIDLGFAHFESDGCQFSLIDVPGHEKFVHTMVAGASGVDAALLVVAADDSVMPQTREHLAVLELLGITNGIIAISKCDLADPEQLEMVELEVTELVAGTFLEGAPMIKVSSMKNQGIDELRTGLVIAARSSPARPIDDPRFRLSIDRAFSPAGQGAVVTGTVSRGIARVGDTLHLLPDGAAVRIRRLQSHGHEAESVTAGQRAAINLVGIKASAIRRGDELTTPMAFHPSRRHLVELKVLDEAGLKLKHRQTARIHLGANQATAQLLIDQREVGPDQTAYAVLHCETPIIAEYGQPFVVRQLSPARTIGGGRFIAPGLRPADRLKRSLEAAAGLASSDPTTRMAAYIDLRRELTPSSITESATGLKSTQSEKIIRKLIDRNEVIRVPGPESVLMTVGRFEQLKQRLHECCQAELDRRKPASHAPLSSVFSAMRRVTSMPVLEAILESLVNQGTLLRRGDQIGVPSGPSLTNRQRSLLEAVLAEIQVAGPTPPSLKELSERHQYPLDDLELLVQVAVDRGELIRVSPLFAISPAALEGLRNSLVKCFQKQKAGTVSEIRELWKMTRKHAVPILEYFDQRQITTRAGDSRTAGPHISKPFEGVSA